MTTAAYKLSLFQCFYQISYLQKSNFGVNYEPVEFSELDSDIMMSVWMGAIGRCNSGTRPIATSMSPPSPGLKPLDYILWVHEGTYY